MDPLTERMQETVDDSFDDVDMVLLVVSARDRIGAGDRFVARRVFSLGVPVIIALNKIDRLKHGHVASQMKEAAKLGDFHALHPVSAKVARRDRRAARRSRPAAPGGAGAVPARAAHRPDARGAGRRGDPGEGAAADPGRGAARVDGGGRRARREGVRARVLVETESQKGILVGKRGAMVREIGTRARPRSRRSLGHPVFLELVVKVRPKWRRDRKTLERLGL